MIHGLIEETEASFTSVGGFPMFQPVVEIHIGIRGEYYFTFCAMEICSGLRLKDGYI